MESVRWPVMPIRTTCGTPARRMLRTAVRRRSWNFRSGTPAAVQPLCHERGVSRSLAYWSSFKNPCPAFCSLTIGKQGSAFTFGGVHLRPGLRAIRKMDNSRLQVVSERPSSNRLRRYSRMVSVLSRETLMFLKYGRMFASMHDFQTLAVDSFTFVWECSRRSSSSLSQVILSAAVLIISPRDFCRESGLSVALRRGCSWSETIFALAAR